MTSVSLPLADAAGNILIDPVRVASLRALPGGVVAVRLNDGSSHKLAVATITDAAAALAVKPHG